MSTLDLKRAAARYLKSVPAVRNGIIFACAQTRQQTRNWVRVVMYHDVTADERPQLARQLRYIRNFAEFVSIDDALALSKAEPRPDGRFVCVTVDDGFESSYTNIAPVFDEFGIKGAFFVIPSLIDPASPAIRHHPRNQHFDAMGFLSWDQCRQMAANGMTIGSHTYSHVPLANLSAAEASDELHRSARAISENVGVECRHFAAPWGQPNKDFDPDRDPALARTAGYHSFLTTVRGAVTNTKSPYQVPREQLEPGWGNYHLRFFLS